MNVIERVCSQIVRPDAGVAVEAQRALDAKTKPRESLGRLEELACHIAAMRGTSTPELSNKAIVVMAADHGVALEGVSAYPQEVTRQMVLNFLNGGAAINVLSRHAGARLLVVDMGTKDLEIPERVSHGELRNLSLAQGTQNFADGPAMSREQALLAVSRGVELADELADDGVMLVALGEMGIGNTTSASALTAVLSGSAVLDVTGSGTGIEPAVRTKKVRVIERALRMNRPDPSDPFDVLHKLGGFELAGLAGLCLGAAARRLPIVLDGFITGAAALVAARIAPAVRDYFIAAHRSREPGHARVLEQLRLRPLLDLDLCLGEGTGAALSLPLIDAALEVLHDMATFESAGVSR
jgi:nicotinate-nucleotide--dimethylbenzimidazole phosphoribosyltransferase